MSLPEFCEGLCDLDEEDSESEPFIPPVWKPGERRVDTCGKTVPEALLRQLLRLDLPLGVHTLRGDLVPKEALPSPWMCCPNDHGYPGLELEVTERTIYIYETHVASENDMGTGGAMASCMTSKEITQHLAWILEAHGRKASAEFALFPELI